MNKKFKRIIAKATASIVVVCGIQFTAFDCNADNGCSQGPQSYDYELTEQSVTEEIDNMMFDGFQIKEDVESVGSPTATQAKIDDAFNLYTKRVNGYIPDSMRKLCRDAGALFKDVVVSAVSVDGNIASEYLNISMKLSDGVIASVNLNPESFRQNILSVNFYDGENLIVSNVYGADQIRDFMMTV